MRRAEVYAILIVSCTVLVWVVLQSGAQLDSSVGTQHAADAYHEEHVMDEHEIRRRSEAALADLHHRVERRLKKYSRTIDGKRRIVRNVKGDKELPDHVVACDLECRLSTCTRHPIGHAKPHEHQRVSAQRMNFSEPQNLKPGKFESGRGREIVERPAWPKVRPESAFWRSRVDQAGIETYQRQYARSSLLEERRGGVPCTEEPYVGYGIGMREHLPSPTTKRKQGIDQDAVELAKRLQRLQNDEPDCENARGVNAIGRGGIGGILKFMTVAFTWAFDQGATFAVYNAYLDPLDVKLWEVLEPPSSCSDLKDNEAPPADTWQMEFTPNFRSGKYSPAEFRHRGHFWWTAHLITFLFKPRPHLAEQIKKERAKVPEGVPFIGVHVRHGDKCEGDRPDAPATPEGYDFRIMDDTKRMQDWRIECPSLTEFMVHAERLRSLYGIKTIWLATDDSDVIDRALTDPCYAHWDFYFMDYTRSNAKDYWYEESDYSGYGLEECQVDPKNIPPLDKLKCIKYRDRLEETNTMVVDLGVLAQADALVVSFSSNIGRVAYELNYAQKQCMPPVISRDIGWCFTDGQIQEGGPYGHLNC